MEYVACTGVADAARKQLEIWHCGSGDPAYVRKSSEQGNVKFRRSLYFVKNLKAGDVITADAVRSVRPGFGLAPKYFSELIGRKLKSHVLQGMATNWSYFEE